MSVKSSKSTLDKRREYDDAFRTEALRLASESRSTLSCGGQQGYLAPNHFETYFQTTSQFCAA